MGDYEFNNLRVLFNMGVQHRYGFNTSLDYGTFYNGHKTTLSVSRGRLGFSNQLSVEPTYTVNKVDLVQGAFTTHLTGTRVTYTMTPLMFTSALLQYNSGTNTFATNVRFRWEYSPGSEFFVVYNDQRDTLAPTFPNLVNRAFVVKISRVLRF